MTDFTDAKTGPNLYPENSVDADIQRNEPILTPDQLVRRFLMGVDFSQAIMKDPFTGKPIRWTPDMFKDYIDGAMNEAEAELGIFLRPVTFREKYPFDRFAYASYGFFNVRQRPVSKVVSVAVTPPNGEDVYSMPLEWVETAYLPRGQINIIPMTAAVVGGTSTGISPAAQNGGSFYLTVVQNTAWVPAYWQIEYVAGYCDGMVPRTINDLIGTIAAMEILSMLAAAASGVNSASLGIDGLSQSTSGPGNQKYKPRIEDLEKKRTLLVKKVKALTGRKVWSSVI